MLRNGSGVKIAIRIMYLILLVLLAIGMLMGLKWFSDYIGTSSITEIWPEGENVIYHCGLILFCVASIVFFIRMMALDFERQMLRRKLKEKQSGALTESKEEVKPAKETKPKEQPVPTENTSEIERLKNELRLERQWRQQAVMLYPNLEKDIEAFAMNISL